MHWNHDDFQKWIESGCQKNNVETLDLSLNELETIPDSISLLTNLCELNLDKNQLETIPRLHFRFNKPSQSFSVFQSTNKSPRLVFTSNKSS